MISIISYCRKPMPKSIQEGNVAKTTGCAHEYLVLDGSKGPQNFAAAYNWAIDKAQGDIVVLLADDCYFMNMNWGAAIEAKFAGDPWLGVAGVAGTQYLFPDKCSWTAAGRPFIKGRIIYHLQNGDFFAALFSPEKGDFEVVACDGCFLALRTAVAKKFRFDDATFTGANFWDLDFCLRARSESRVIITGDVTVKKTSQPAFDADWQAAGARFLEKYQAVLPVSCVETVPDPAKFISSSMVNLKGKASPETIC